MKKYITNGIASVIVIVIVIVIAVSLGITNIAPEEIRQLLVEACASFKLYHNENNGGSGNEA